MFGRVIVSLLLISLLVLPAVTHAALLDQVNQAFESVYGRLPTFSEWEYWAGRVVRGEKTTYEALVGAMAYQKAQAGTTALVAASAVAPATPASASFKIDPKYYPSPHSPNHLPDGTLITAPSTSNVYYVRDGKKSWVLPSVLNKWLNENHFFKHNIIITLSDADLARYPTAPSVNKIYVGKILQHPTGTQFYIDDKLRKRPISAAVRTALRVPGGNAYPTSAAHLAEFATGAAITDTSKYPGGYAFYDGPFHGGRIWKTETRSDGSVSKHLYLKDRFYEADGYPDESQRSPVDATTLARHARGANVDRYPDGWLVQLDGAMYLMQGGKLRHITSPQIMAAMGYGPQHIRAEYPELYKTYARGEPIRAFKNIVNGVATTTASAPAVAPSAAYELTKVRPHIRAIIAEMNTLIISVFDRDATVADNTFWVNYIYNGEVATKDALLAAMRSAKSTGKLPALTSRTATLSEERLEQHWFPYLFYFVHQTEPSEADRDYWFARIRPGDRDTIEKLGGTLQWIKDNYGTTRR